MFTLAPRVTVSAELTSAYSGSLSFGALSDEIAVMLYPYARGPQGIQGIPGDTGPVGPSADTYEHTQVSPSNEWIVNHNFGRKPVVDVMSVGGVVVEADVRHLSPNQVRIYFNQPQAGNAIAR